jgi:hypothetical protein
MAAGRRVQPSNIQHEEDPEHPDRSYPVQSTQLLRLWGHYVRAVESWHHLQIGYREHYSVERLLAFRDYCERTSHTRAFAVCALTPVPAAAVLLLIECIPLRRSDEGWAANWTMFVRILVTATFVAGGIVFLAQTIIDEGKVATAQAIRIAVFAAVCYTGLGVLLAATWTYPIPFGAVILVCPFVALIMTLFLASIDRHALKTNKKLRKQVLGHFLGASAQSLLVVAYPTFSALFRRFSGVEQTIFMVALPVIKFITKQVLYVVSAHLRELTGVMLVFSVDVFHVLYMAICIQTARSSVTTLVIVIFDVLQIALALRSIYRHTSVLQQQNDLEPSTTKYVDKLLAIITTFTPQGHQNHGTIRLAGPYRMVLSPSSAEPLGSLDIRWKEERENNSSPFECQKPIEGTSRPSSPDQMVGPSDALIPHRSAQDTTPTSHYSEQKATTVNGCRLPPHSVVPQAPIYPQPKPTICRRSTPQLDGSRDPPKAETAIEEGLQALFHCEYVIMSEYIECVLPLVYAGYFAGLYHLPTAVFYPFTRSLTSAKMTSTLVQLVLYGSLEIVSFVGMHVILKARLGYSPVLQLSFILQTHAVMIQSLLFLWIIFIVQLTFDHSGKCVPLGIVYCCR